MAFGESLGARTADAPEVETKVRAMLGRALWALNQLEAAEDQFRRVLEVQRATHGELDQSVFEALRELTSILGERGHEDTAELLVREALERAIASGGDGHPQTARRLGLLADALVRTGDLDQAELCAKQVLASYGQLFGDRHELVLEALEWLSLIHRMNWRYPDAAQVQHRIVLTCRELFGPLHPRTLANSYYLSRILPNGEDRDRTIDGLREAVAAARTAVGRHATEQTDLTLGDCLRFLAVALTLREVPVELREAEVAAREALALYSTWLEPRDPRLVHTMALIGTLCQVSGRPIEAEAQFREVLALLRRCGTIERQNAAGDALGALSILLLERDIHLAEGEAVARESLALAIRTNGMRHWTTWINSYTVALYCRLRGAIAEAETLEAQATDSGRDRPGFPSLVVAHTTRVMGDRYTEFGLHELAELLLRESHRLCAFLAPGRRRHVESTVALADCLIAQEKFAEAEELLGQAWATFVQDGAPGDTADFTACLHARVILYESWHAAEPDEGHDAKAAEWREQLAAWRASTQPGAP